MSMEVSVTLLIPLNMIPSQCAWTGYQESIEYMKVLYGADLQTFIGQRNDKRPKKPTNLRTEHAFRITYQPGLVPCANCVFADTKGTNNLRRCL
jgi:hypothetical protein